MTDKGKGEAAGGGFWARAEAADKLTSGSRWILAISEKVGRSATAFYRSPRKPGSRQKHWIAESETAVLALRNRVMVRASLAAHYGLDIVELTWEDTGRHKGSALGPNISDMTIQVQQLNPLTGRRKLSLMPVIRYPNFADLSADLPLNRLKVLVRVVSLQELLGNLRRYLHNPRSWAGNRNSLLAPRDSHVLVSAQAAFLPIPAGGSAQFNPVLFNYQSYPGNPGVLAILATREGTSITVIENRPEEGWGEIWGQRLFFNQNGERASLTGQRLSDFQAQQAAEPTPRDPDSAEVPEEALNLVMLKAKES